jgi:hypothetical protein
MCEWKEEIHVEWRTVDWRTVNDAVVHDEIDFTDLYALQKFAGRAPADMDIFSFYKIKRMDYKDPVSQLQRSVFSERYMQTPFYAIDGKIHTNPGKNGEYEEFMSLMGGAVVKTRHGRHYATHPLEEWVVRATRIFHWVVPLSSVV